ncbi:hypothetical protein BGZ54_007373, partial [Gamsiella multidivaricata]
VPTLSEYQKIHLQALGVSTKADQINRLQEELMEQYAENEADITRQKDFFVLDYLSMIHSEGLSQAIYELALQVMGREEYKGTFLSLKENDFADEDSSDNDMFDDDDDSDPDYEDTKPATDDQKMQVVKAVLRDRTVDKVVSLEDFSSAPSSPYPDEDYSRESFRETIDGFMDTEADLQDRNCDVILKANLRAALDTMELLIDLHGLRNI